MKTSKSKNTAPRGARKPQKRTVAELPDESEIWRSVIAHQDHLAAVVKEYEPRQRLAHQAGNKFVRAYQKHHGLSDAQLARQLVGLEQYATATATQAKKDLAEFKRRQRKLRTGGKAYSLATLQKLAESPTIQWLAQVVSVTREALAKPTDRKLLLAATNRLVEAKWWFTRKEEPSLDLPSLGAEARAWCNLPNKSGAKRRYETPTVRAYYVVARATGWHPDKQSAPNALTPDQVASRTKSIAADLGS